MRIWQVMISLGLAGFSLVAQGGDNTIAAGIYFYQFDSSSDDLRGAATPPGLRAKAGNTESAALVYTRKVSEKWALVAALGDPPDYRLNGDAAAAALGFVAQAQAISPALMAQRYFYQSGPVRGFAGLGFSYNTYTSTVASDSLNLALGGMTSIEIDNSFAPLAIAGIDYNFHPLWVATLSASYIDLQAEVLLTTGTIERRIDVDLNPVVFRLTLGYRF